MLGPRQPALPVEFLFEILYVGAPPTCITVEFLSKFSMLRPCQPALSVEIGVPISLC